jgi:hypothetical protein
MELYIILIREYSKCSLTVPTDRRIAMSALEDRIKGALKHRPKGTLKVRIKRVLKDRINGTLNDMTVNSSRLSTTPVCPLGRGWPALEASSSSTSNMAEWNGSTAFHVQLTSRH